MQQDNRDDPFMDQGLKLWIVKMAKRNFWRVSRWYDLDDLIADGYMCYARTRARYPDLVKPPLVYGQKARFVSMFKRIYMNEIHDLSNSRTRSVEEVGFTDLVPSSRKGHVQTEHLEHLLGVQDEEGTLRVKFAQAPMCVQMLLSALETEEGRQQMRGRLRRTSTHKETLNDRLCRIAGVDPEAIDLEWELRDAFSA